MVNSRFLNNMNSQPELLKQPKTEIIELINEFLNSRFVDSSSINSRKAYQADLRLLINYFNKLSEITELKLRDLKLFLLDNYAANTAARKWSAWREFLRYCQLIGKIQYNPIFELSIDINITDRKLKNKISHTVLKSICDSAETLRDRALLWFIYSTGIRVSEMEKFAVFSNLNLAAKEFYIENRITFLCERAFNLLNEYLQERKEKIPFGLSEYIFINEMGYCLKDYYIYNLFYRISEKFGIHASVGDLRDSLTLRLYEFGASPEELKYILGFKSFKSIEPILRLQLNYEKT